MSESTLSKLPLAHCDNCPLKDCPVVPPWGDASPKAILVGEAPGQEEVREGRPFVGRAGNLLEALLADIGEKNTPIYLTNAVMCRPPQNAKPDPLSIECCRDRLQKELFEHWAQTTPVVLLGNAAVEAVLGQVGAISGIRGAWYTVGTYNYLPTWHPAYILRSPEDAAELERDLNKAFKQIHWNPVNLDNPPKVIWLDTPEKLYEVVKDWDGMHIAFDFESSQVDWKREAALMMGMAISTKAGYIVTDDMLYDSPAAISILNNMARNNHLVGHNAKYDLHVAEKLGLTAFKDAVVFDTMLAHYVLDERKGGHGLKKLAREYFDVKDYDKDMVHKYLKSKNDDWSKVPPESLAQYCVLDVVITLALKSIMENELRAEGLYEWPYKEVIMKAHMLAFAIEELGMAIDVPHLQYWKSKLEDEKELYHQELCNISGHPELNPRSAIQLARIVWDERKLMHPPTQTWDKVKGQVNLNPRSTSEVALFHLANVVGGEVTGYDDEFLDMMFKYRRVAKVLSTYIDPILEKVDEEGRFHDEIKVHGTETGRLATFLHTIPRETTDIYGRIVRSAFVATPGYKFLAVDYSQGELRGAAAISKEPFLIDTYARGGDVHTEVTKAVFGDNAGKEQRIIIKRYNFAYLYGGGAAALVSDSNIPKNVAHKIMRDYEAKMSALAAWKRGTQEFMLTHGYVQTPFGRRRRFPYINDGNYNEAVKAAVNTPIQSTVADLTTLAAYELTQEGYRVLLTKHDECIVEVPEEGADEHRDHVIQAMQNIASRYFPEVVWVADGELKDRWCEPPEA